MRSVLRHTTRSLARKRPSAQTHILPAVPQTVQVARNPRRDAVTPRPTASSRTTKRAVSSSISSSPEGNPELDGTIVVSGATPPEGPSEEGPAEDGYEVQEKPADGERVRRVRKTKAETADTPPLPPPLPEELNILWTPETMEPSSPSALPPPEIMDKVLADLHVSLHPQTQHRAAYASPSSGAVSEPTLALYCPFEGGDYVVDETVRELARRTDSEVLVLDAVQIAAGESGCFGEAASVFQFPENPLHFRAPASRSVSLPMNRSPSDHEDESPEDSPFFPSHMTVTVMQPLSSSRQGRLGLSKSASSSPGFKIKAFFDALLRIPSTSEAENLAKGRKRSRLIYVRDYPMLAESASTWYPSLLAAIRQRRQGPISRSHSPVSESITIIFGVTPSIVCPSNTPPFNPQALLGLMNSKQGMPIINLPSRPSKHEYGEDEHADKARERRLKERLRKWERNENALLEEEIPGLPDSDRSSPGKENSGLVLLGPGMPGGSGNPPPSLFSALQGRPESQGDGGSNEGNQFFRSSVLVPSVRNPGLERSCRISRRREINELTMRMGVSGVGGVIDESLPGFVQAVQAQDSPDEVIIDNGTIDPNSDISRTLSLWAEWGKNVQLWKNVKNIADRAVGSIMAQSSTNLKPSLEATPVPWSAIVSAWDLNYSLRELKKSWVREAGGKVVKEPPESDAVEEPYQPTQDELIQRIKEDPDLPSHEQRLLGCIVDSASMQTSFNDVHLPAHTIDSVRTIVSLPLLYPAAFQQGILKQHSMTGCLLFGPPGTGKTLVVRALAKEAGCRMLAVQPSDVMDMYVGEGEKLVRSVFSLARRLSPCVVFLDEIDALFGARSSSRESGSSLAHNGVITEFMQEMDGLKSRRDSNVIVIGATNRPFDLDDAILRRLPRRMLVDLPGVKEREEIFKILLRDELLASDVDLSALAKRTELFSGSDLKHVCVSAALDAVKEGITLPWSVPKSEETGASTATEQKVVAEAELAPVREETENTQEQESNQTSEKSEGASSSSDESPQTPEEPRVLYLRHFNKALKEISPSSSESLGSLSALRKWNEEFGEGQKKKRKTIWGKGAFGFIEPKSDAGTPLDGHVSTP